MNDNLNKYKTSIVRRAHFNAAHRLENQEWGRLKNIAVFGKCNNPNYHGHNYDLEVKVTGFVDPQTGFVMDAKKLSNLIENEVVELLDHKNLNMDVLAFKDLNPTAENIAFIIYQILRSKINTKHELKIKLYETPRNFVEYPS